MKIPLPTLPALEQAAASCVDQPSPEEASHTRQPVFPEDRRLPGHPGTLF